jgi:EAL domain-containing protein (putative c-di-GMP-specific phosphodiesterase class I)/CheY-like chemotaxis protein
LEFHYFRFGSVSVSIAALTAQPRRQQVLILDDEPAIRQLIRKAAETSGCDVREFGDVESAASSLSEVVPDLIFLDLELGSGDAIEAFRAFAGHGYQGTIQLMSGRGEAVLDNVKAVGARYGFNLLTPMPKPFRRSRIIEALTQVAPQPTAHLHPAPHVTDTSSSFTLNEALNREWLELWYQPKVDLRSGRVVGAEGLIRARHPDLGIVGPIAFLTNASDEALANLTDYVIRSALQAWQAFEDVCSPFHLCVNAPASALLSLPIAQIIRRNRPTSVAWPGLVLELTEDQIVDNIALAQEIAAQLKIYDVELSLDDFGQGYSSLARLRDLPFTSLKIDRTFVMGCATDPVKQDVIKTIVALGQRFGCTIVAEGIESQAELEIVKASGCEYGQGYFLGKPMTKTAFISSLAASTHRVCAA